MGRPRKKSTNKQIGRRKSAKSKLTKQTLKKSSPPPSPLSPSPPPQSSIEEISSSILAFDGSDDVNNVDLDDSSKLADPIVVKNLRVCSKDCECPPSVTWYVCKFCWRAFETHDGLRSHRRLSLSCHKRSKSKISTQLDDEKEEVGRNVSEKPDVDFEIPEDFDMEDSQSAPADEAEDEISDGESSNASTVFVIRKAPKINYSNGYNKTESPGPSTGSKKYSVSSNNDNCHQRTIQVIQLTC